MTDQSAALRESEDRFRELFRASPDALFLLDRTGRFLDCNKTAEERYGYSRAELLLMTAQDLAAPDLRAQAGAQVQQALASGISFEWRQRRKDGTELPVEISAKPFVLGGQACVLSSVRDLTERKRSEEQLRQSELRFREVFRASPAAMTITRIADGTFVDANQAFLRIMEFSRDEVIGHTSTELGMWTPDERTKLIEQQLRTGGLRDAELRARTRTGRMVDVLFSSTEIVLADELHHVTTMVDVTERRRAEEALRENEAVMKALLDNLPVGLAVNAVEPAVTFTYMNDNFPRFYRTTRERLADPDAFWDAVYEEPAFRDVMRRRVLDDVASGDPERMVWPDIPITRRGEDTHFITARNVPVPGTPLMMSTVWDVTERKRLEMERQKFFLIAESSSEFIGMCDLDLQPLYVNPAGCSLVGLPDMDAACRVMVPDYFFPEDRGFIADEFFPRVMRDGHGDVEIRLRHFVTGEPIWVFYSLFSVRDADGTAVGWATVSRDITERKRAEEEQARLQAQLTQAQRMESVGRLAGGVAHDFNNMLGVILGHTELLLSEMDENDPLRADVTEIQKAGMRSADLTRQLLAFARKQTVAPKVIDLNETVEGALRMLERLIGEDIELAWLPGTDVWPVRIDPSQVDQVLANLCANARDAIAGVGRVVIETRNIVIDDTDGAGQAEMMPGDFVMMAVSDNGCGMDVSTLSNVFEPFFTTKQLGAGTGLGLATVYGAVRQNDGFITVYSEPGQGTTFKIYLPRQLAEADRPTDRRPIERAARGHETILLVEDEPAILTMATTMLERAGYAVLGAGTPREAIRRAAEHDGPIDLVVSDVVMPEMNGNDLARSVVAIHPGARCLFMSGYTENVIAHHGVLDEGVNFIQKPFSSDDLAAKVREALDGE